MILKFKFSNYKKLLFKEFSIQILEKFLRLILGFVIISQLSDYLGPEEYGALLFIESNYILFLGFSGFGLAPNVIKYLSQKKIGYKNYVFNALLLGVLSSFIGFLSINIWALSLKDFPYSAFFFPVSFLILFNPIYFIEYYFNSLNKIRVGSVIRLIAYIFCFLLKIFAIIQKLGFEIFIYILIIESVLVYILLLTSIIKKGILFKFNFYYKKTTFFEIFRSTLFIFLYSLGVNLFYRIDILMIQKLLSLEDLGNYTASYKIISFGYVLPAIFSETFFPRILMTKENDSKIIKKMYFFSFWVSVIIFLFVYMSSDFIINSIFDIKYIYVHDLFKISCLVLIIIGLSSTYVKVLYKNNLQQNLFYKIIIGILLAVSLNYILIPIFGVFGVSYATVITVVFLEVFYDFFDKKLRMHHIIKLKSVLFFNPLK
ncbi:MAG: oligosaccharide flippase family protein [Flavobacteriaceae bacterium]